MFPEIKTREILKSDCAFKEVVFDSLDELLAFRKTHHCMTNETFRTKNPDGTYSDTKYRTHEVISTSHKETYKYIYIYNVVEVNSYIDDWGDCVEEEHIVKSFLKPDDAKKYIEESNNFNLKIDKQEVILEVSNT